MAGTDLKLQRQQERTKEKDGAGCQTLAGTGPARGWRAQPTLTLMLSMPSLVTVNNNVSLLSIIITPSTYVATLTLSFVFVYLYIVQISWKPTLLPNINYFERTTAEAEPPKPQLLFLP
ncbi:hypothetical protein CaCOL14_013186 [Colletotrichum acutatum]